MKKITFVTAIAVALSACAAPPSLIKPAKVQTTESCSKMPQVREELRQLSLEQREVRFVDGFTTTFFMLPAASMAGASKKDEIAVVKGRLDVLEERCY